MIIGTISSDTNFFGCLVQGQLTRSSPISISLAVPLEKKKGKKNARKMRIYLNNDKKLYYLPKSLVLIFDISLSSSLQ